MEEIGKPVRDIKHIREMVQAIMEGREQAVVDFSNTKAAFAIKSDDELKKSAWLFGLMNKHWLVGIGSRLGLAAIRLHLPFVESVVKNTIFEQFCGGTTLLECQGTIGRLAGQGCLTILDYGAEAKEKEEDFNHTMNETIRAIEFASRSAHIPVVSTKVTGMARFGLLEALQQGESFTKGSRKEYKSVLKRLDSVCHVAARKGVSVFFDAEESWIQDSIDHLVTVMMRRYNREKAVVYNTFQLYRKDRLQFLIDSYNLAKKGGYLLGAKLVRGAYMEKERDRAEKMGYPSPIHPNKPATDDAYDMALRFCVDNYESIASCNASHNLESNLLQAELIRRKGLLRNHPHLNFCQLYGMSDNITFNLAKEGFNVAKYVPYGPVRDVVPYLIRRAQENSSITGDMSREFQLVQSEMKRRGLA
ncbi:MAG: proline dehydrogenase family protein [Phaeodactylibacter sp.]|nr:proline dehydrogenase family protein [Phaeodactylibacter sp.]MCB9053238.1 proline dehydrogenase family protein [Lewinellaceae bacterium]